jgi:hypothetical protein
MQAALAFAYRVQDVLLIIVDAWVVAGADHADDVDRPLR